MELKQCLNFQLSSTQTAVNNCFKAKLGKIGLSPIQYAIIECLIENGDMSPTQLSEELFQNNSTITNQLSKLEDNGFLVREFNTDDRRMVTVRLTSKGNALKKEYDKIILDTNNILTEHFSKKEISEFSRLLKKCFDIYTSIDSNGETTPV